MKIKFKENEGEISIELIIENNSSNFDYINFIENLYNGKEIEELLFEGNISDEIKEALKNITEKVNSIVESSQIQNNDLDKKVKTKIKK